MASQPPQPPSGQPDTQYEEYQSEVITETTNRPTPAADVYEITPTNDVMDDRYEHEHDDYESGAMYETVRTWSPQSRPELVRIASVFSRIDSHPDVAPTTEDGGQLNRRDTLAGVKIGDPVLDPTKPEFDFYKWARMFTHVMEKEGIKRNRTGVMFRNLTVLGSGSAVQYQDTFLSPFAAPFRPGELCGKGRNPEKVILHDFNGAIREGELLMVLGRPGSGCSTFLKAICGELHGLQKKKESIIHYNGVSQHTFKKELRGEAVYSAEDEHHFPHLTVGQTLEFAAAARTPSKRVLGLSRKDFSTHLARVMMSVFGLSHTYNTKVGDDYVRGVSGGERKRVSIAEIALSGAPICCWDNSTRGLDSATALEFTKALKIGSQVGGITQCLAIYQASQAIYDIFDKVIVLYEGRQIFFGPTRIAKQYFEEMGWYCPPRQTTADFLTSVTNPKERIAKEGYENRVPRTAVEFERYWKQSQNNKLLLADMDRFEAEYPLEEGHLEKLRETHGQAQAKHTASKSPYRISVPMQVKLCTVRAYQRLWGDKSSTIATNISQIMMALIIGSLFFDTPQTTDGFFAKGSVIFFAILLNGLMSITEINGLCKATDPIVPNAQRPIVVKHVNFAFYHAYSEALAGIVADIPIKFLLALVFNIIIYFLGGLERSAAKFFIFFLFTFITILTMSAIFRTLAAATKTIPQALALAGVMILALVIYTGFTLQPSYMHPWFKWILYINPIAYAYEALLVNEVHGNRYRCATPIPPYGSGTNFACAVAGAVPGEMSVSGDAWVESSYDYSYAHIWRNLGILLGFLAFFYFVYLVVSELNLSSASSAEFLVFRRGHLPKNFQGSKDEEAAAGGVMHPNDPARLPPTNTNGAAGETAPGGSTVAVIPPQKDIFTWRNVTYDITIKGEPRRLLDNISGWVRPGTLTALMGVSGAGKTTLLDALAQRTTMGVITGDMLVNGRPLDSSFQRKTGYVQQQDLHLETTTVREALRFSADLRQPKSVSRKEKYEYVEDVIKMLSMEDFSEAVVGNPGEGLNVEQRKLLTIGVELAAKPQLLLFLDEPTSGLDSQSSWSIVTFLRKLADNGQAVLSTIHQPSGILFEQFDRLLFLAKGGRTVYFGDIGKNSETLLNYFETHGAEPCGPSENPAEYMLNIVGAGPSGKSKIDWPAVWKESEESRHVQQELDRIQSETSKRNEGHGQSAEKEPGEFAMPFTSQLYCVTTRVFQQYWRTPSYIWGKLLLGLTSALFIGFSFFLQNSSMAGLQNSLFSIFMLTTIFSSLVQQIMPRFVTQRDLFEVRERPSRAYSWKVFLLANIIVEIPYQILLGIIAWASLFYPTFGAHLSSERQGILLLYCVQFFIFASTFAQMIIAGLPDAETAGGIATTMFGLMVTFNGVLQKPNALPGFWRFMWRVSPITYTVGGLAATSLHSREVKCAQNELAIFDPPSGATCAQYLQKLVEAGAPGKLYNPMSTSQCQYCPLSSGDQFLGGSEIHWSDRWRNFGIGWAYIVFNIFATVALYYLIRVRKSSGRPNRIISVITYHLSQFGTYCRAFITGRKEKCPRKREQIGKIY
ncbi:ABC transporter [Trichophyton tonsurans CBS 112818]|uniref:ABC multidrug transporter MDR1 n=1 Tax=Trichophyton tonsurans (strain CBS 112818) TaxID=647933 RepID=MDR1_TRIT1|nr:RecName: Full=ABC multidrug transporter MDR1; AltName: Full=Multidrug resistance protein 1 [Trichophyton tonsurans CBS 112818]EGD94355.1 ABC transporter [Trichophyton tonsurans CBS 112818]